VLQSILTNSTAGTSFNWFIAGTTPAGTDYKIKISSALDPAITDESNANFSITLGTPNGTITVTSPNGAEVWQIGTHHNITWTTTCTENVVIELLKGGVYQATLANYGTGSTFDWYISPTLPAGTDYKVVISSALDPAITDTSNANFSLCLGTPNGWITVTSPDGGEIWQLGSHETITWTTNVTENVIIELYKGGAYYSTLANYGTGTSFDWYIDPTLPAGTDYKINISSVLDPAINDMSDADFSLVPGTPSGSITVTSPNGGENWWVGSTYTITWTTTITENVMIELYKGGVLHSVLTNWGSGGSYNWYVSPGILTGSDYKIKISSILNPSINDMSDANFSLWAFDVVIYPNPAKLYCKIKFSNVPNGIYNIQLYNRFGSQLLSQFVNTEIQPEYRISTAELPNGIYFLKVISDDFDVSRRIIVNH
jgi:hypothetical protein